MMMIFAHNLFMGCFPILVYIEFSGFIFIMGGEVYVYNTIFT